MYKKGTRFDSLVTNEIIIIKGWFELQQAYLCEIWEISYNIDGSYDMKDIEPDYRFLTENDLKRRGF